MRASSGHSLLDDPRWSAFHLWKNGELVEENAARCPIIMGLLERRRFPASRPVRQWRWSRSSARNAHSAAQRNAQHAPICHIPLIVPGGCRLRVGAETREVVEGRAMIFDDSIEHEAWNDGDSARAVLLFEIWRPELETPSARH